MCVEVVWCAGSENGVRERSSKKCHAQEFSEKSLTSWFAACQRHGEWVDGAGRSCARRVDSGGENEGHGSVIGTRVHSGAGRRRPSRSALPRALACWCGHRRSVRQDDAAVVWSTGSFPI